MKDLQRSYNAIVTQMLAEISIMSPGYTERMQKRANVWARDLMTIWTAAEKKRQRFEEVVTELDAKIEGEVDTPEEVKAVEEVLDELVEVAQDVRQQPRLKSILGKFWSFVFDKSQMR